MAVEHLLLGATAVGLGACFFGLFEHEAAVLAALGVPDGWRAVGTIALGHPAPDEPGRSAARPRLPWPTSSTAAAGSQPTTPDASKAAIASATRSG